jgi:hypothetical protein
MSRRARRRIVWEGAQWFGSVGNSEVGLDGLAEGRHQAAGRSAGRLDVLCHAAQLPSDGRTPRDQGAAVALTRAALDSTADRSVPVSERPYRMIQARPCGIPPVMPC